MIFNDEKQHLLRHVDPQRAFYAQILDFQDLFSQSKYSRERVQKMIWAYICFWTGLKYSRKEIGKPMGMIFNDEKQHIYRHVDPQIDIFSNIIKLLFSTPNNP